LPRNPWAYGDRVRTPVDRYSCLHKLFPDPEALLAVRRVSVWEYSPTDWLPNPVASVPCLSPVIFSARARLTSELLRFL